MRYIAMKTNGILMLSEGCAILLAKILYRTHSILFALWHLKKWEWSHKSRQCISSTSTRVQFLIAFSLYQFLTICFRIREEVRLSEVFCRSRSPLANIHRKVACLQQLRNLFLSRQTVIKRCDEKVRAEQRASLIFLHFWFNLVRP